MPMFRVFSRGTCLGINVFGQATPVLHKIHSVMSFSVARSGTAEQPLLCYPVETELRKKRWTTELRFYCLHHSLPTVVSKCFVGFRHLVRIFALLDGVSAAVRGVHDLTSELVLHRFLAARCRVADQPANRKSRATRRT